MQTSPETYLKSVLLFCRCSMRFTGFFQHAVHSELFWSQWYLIANVEFPREFWLLYRGSISLSNFTIGLLVTLQHGIVRMAQIMRRETCQGA